MATMFVRPLTWTGNSDRPVDPLPSMRRPPPQDQTVPSLSSAKPLLVDAATATATDGRPVTATGVVLIPAVPVPSSPLGPLPQASTVPSVVSSYAACAPAAMLATPCATTSNGVAW